MFKFKNKKLIYFVVCVFFLLLVANLSPSVRTPFLNLLEHPFSLLALIGREFKGIIFYHSNYVNNERLEREKELLERKIASLEEINLENERLKKIISFKIQSPYKVIASRIIAHSPDNWTSSIIIDKGSNNGIKRGMAVISYSGLVGRVIEATGLVSKIMLMSDPSFAVSAIDQRSRQEGLITGTLGSNLIMKYLPEGADVKIQDTVITSGLNEGYPKGLAIGTVVDVGKELSGLSNYAIIKPTVNLSSIEEVLIIIQ